MEETGLGEDEQDAAKPEFSERGRTTSRQKRKVLWWVLRFAGVGAV